MKNKKSSGRTVLAHVVLIILAFLCLFFFYILIVNATRSHAQLQLGFSALPGSSLLTNFKSVINDPAIPILKGIQNSLIVSGCCAAIVTYFSALTAYGIYAYDFKLKRAAFTFIMAILVMPTQVTALGFLRLITGMGLDDSLLPLIIPSIASPAVFYFMHSYMQSSLPKELIEAARIDGATQRQLYFRITLPLMKPVIVFVVIMQIIAVFQLWEVVYLLTNGGPNYSTMSMGYLIYNTAFVSGKYGLAAAQGVVLTLVILFFSMMSCVTSVITPSFPVGDSDIWILTKRSS